MLQAFKRRDLSRLSIGRWQLSTKPSTRTASSSVTGRIRVTPEVRTHLVFGANTDVGKTVISAGLVRASAADQKAHYIKPLQCGGSDQGFVEQYLPPPLDRSVSLKTLFSWDTPASPHTASRHEQHPESDKHVLSTLQKELSDISHDAHPSTTWIETAGGVMSPSSASPLNQSPRHADAAPNEPWGWSTQADLYQPLLGMAPVVLVGDGRLGGISATLSSLESLILRGYDVAGLVLLETEFANLSALQEYAARAFKLRSGSGKTLFSDPTASIISLPQLPSFPEPLHDWYESSRVKETLSSFNQHLDTFWHQHVQELTKMRSSARDVIWWPFTQHGMLNDDNKVTLIDSASGDDFHVLRESISNNGLERLSQFDACASWWTQGLGHGESSLALAAAAAAGRYGHVIFPDVVHAPALKLSQLLVGPTGPGHGWADRVFFTDDGSTAMEVAIKMGMKTYQKWHEISEADSKSTEWAVCAQQDCYHGDTLGVMDVAEPSVFNEGQHPWYEPKGLFLPTPTLGFQEGELQISFPAEDAPDFDLPPLASIDDAMDVSSRRDSHLSQHYHNCIHKAWDAYEESDAASQHRRIGSVLLEPILMGAGGMKFVDPLWQRSLMDYARAKRVPVVFDEVASGLYRVGVSSCREILKADPDVASYAKLLTGGLLPLSVTLASEDVFETFLGDEKGQALLHGHSYTAHPVGCVSSIQALEAYQDVFAQAEGSGSIRNLFDTSQVKELSLLPIVQQSFALGTVLAVTVRPDESGGTGYAAASRTTPMAQRLRGEGVYVRPLGNVLYIMASPVTSPDECQRLCGMLHNVLREFGEEASHQVA